MYQLMILSKEETNQHLKQIYYHVFSYCTGELWVMTLYNEALTVVSCYIFSTSWIHMYIKYTNQDYWQLCYHIFPYCTINIWQFTMKLNRTFNVIFSIPVYDIYLYEGKINIPNKRDSILVPIVQVR